MSIFYSLFTQFKGNVKLCLEKVKKGKYRDQENGLKIAQYNFLKKPMHRARLYFEKQ